MTKKNISDETASVALLKNELGKFLKERNWEKYHVPKNLSMSIAIEAAELMEHFQWLTSEEARNRKPNNLSEIEEEVADIVLYCLSMARYFDIDLSHAIANKIAKNRAKYPAKEYHGRF